MKITIIGAGAMGGAIARGLVKSNAVSASDITVTAKTQKTLDSFAHYGINTSLDNRKAVANADIVCLAVKPWLMEEVINGIKDTLDYSRQMIISVAAGISAKQITEWMQRDGKMAPLFLV
ncbi:NAD(P)-binding domain-containing protein, partial [Parabacteroides distasonis]